MKSSLKTFSSLIFSAILFLFSCEKGEKIETISYMRISLEAFYSDTSLFQTVQLNDKIVVNDAKIVGGSTNTLLSNYGQAFDDSTRLRVTVVKKNNPNLSFDSIIYVSNVNEFLLLQLDPKKKPVFINKRLENATAVKPGKDSIKVRFFFSSEEDFRSKIPGNTKASTLRLRLYFAERQPDGSYKKNTTLIQTINNIRVNELSPYYTFYFPDNKEYLFDIFDARSGNFTDAQRLIQRYDFDEDYFVDSYIGRVEKQTGASGLFQTMRITRTTNNNGIRGINAPFLFGLN